MAKNSASLLCVKKELELDVRAKRKTFGLAKKHLKEVRQKKNKIDTPILVDLENIL
jgi:hypothetical protein